MSPQKTLLSLTALLLLVGCPPESPNTHMDYKQAMRDFVIEISQYAKTRHPNFIVIPQNGAELVSRTGDDTGSPEMNYVQAINGIGQESLFYGYYQDDQATPQEERQWTSFFLDMAKSNSDTAILVTDYCDTPNHMDDSYLQNQQKGYISFAADARELDTIPSYPSAPHNENTAAITELSQAKNFLYLINPQRYATAQALVDAISATNYDLVILDFFFSDQSYTPAQIAQLKTKANGAQRLLIAYMSIGEAEDYRYYWQENWTTAPPEWLKEENPNWPGNYRVVYWQEEWKSIIYGDDTAYLDKILHAGFDGVYLDIIDAFEYFEEQ